MTMIAERDRQTIRGMLSEGMVDDVELVLYTRPRAAIFVPGRQDCMSCAETKELLTELADLSDKLTLSTVDVTAQPEVATSRGVTEVPTVMVQAKSEPPSESDVRFLGLPGGYEFSTLLATIVDVSKGDSALDPATRETLQQVTDPVHIQVFVTPT
jgi:alkyl hydroperoxide reductase subunit AhpF